GFTVAASLVFLLAAEELGTLCFFLAPFVLAVLFYYSFSKRFTTHAHLILGFCLGMAPAGAWIAVRGSLSPSILWLTTAVMFWTAGFDVIYACQDYEFDRREGLFSIPKAVGIAKALQIARLFHALMIVCLLSLAFAFHLGILSIAGIVLVVVLLIYEHGLVKP